MSFTWSAEELAAWSGGVWTRRPAELRGFSFDTRTLQAGELFVALRTDKRDGHDFVDTARQKGAAGALVERPQPGIDLPQLVVDDTLTAWQACATAHRRRYSPQVIAITGSSGKTSTKELLAHALRTAYGPDAVCATQGNLNNHLGVPLTLLSLRPQHRFLVVEIGMNRPGEIAQLVDLAQPQIALITGVGAAHLEGVGDEEGVAREKASLAAVASVELACFPADCLRFAPFQQLRPRRRVVAHRRDDAPPAPVETVYFEASYEPAATNSNVTSLSGARGCRLCVWQPPLSPREWSLPLLSEGALRNVALVASLLPELAMEPEVFAQALSSWRPAHQRGQVVNRGQRQYFLDCYNANPQSMADSLRFFRVLFPEPPRLYVLGGMKELGTQSARYHQEIGRQLELAGADKALFVGAEAPHYVEGLRATAPEAEAQSQVFATTDEVAPAMAAFAGPVFLKGSRAYALERLLELSEAYPPC